MNEGGYFLLTVLRVLFRESAAEEHHYTVLVK